MKLIGKLVAFLLVFSLLFLFLRIYSSYDQVIFMADLEDRGRPKVRSYFPASACSSRRECFLGCSNCLKGLPDRKGGSNICGEVPEHAGYSSTIAT